jgi:hypothetical protein
MKKYHSSQHPLQETRNFKVERNSSYEFLRLIAIAAVMMVHTLLF